MIRVDPRKVGDTSLKEKKIPSWVGPTAVQSLLN